jgi:hypothetical protein
LSYSHSSSMGVLVFFSDLLVCRPLQLCAHGGMAVEPQQLR